MNPLLRTLRGVMGIGLTWAALWAAVFAVLILVVGVFRPGDIDAGEGPIEIAAIMGFVGLVSGVAFGVLLSLAENGRAILDLSRGRVALWGGLASAAYPFLSGVASR